MHDQKNIKIYTCVTFLLIFMYYVLLSIITSPVLTAASSIFVTSTSVPLTDGPSINTSSACATYLLLLLKNVLFGLVSIFLITLSSTILNGVIDSASPYL